MGYEVTYKYHPKKEDGNGYNTDEVKELTKKVGKAFDDMPSEKLAAVVMSQLARRDIWIIDVEIFEFIRKKISFKESKDGRGVVIKNKKFSLDAAACLIEEGLFSEDLEENSVLQATKEEQGLQPHEIVARQKKQVVKNATPQGKPQSWLVFDPMPQMLPEVQSQGLRFTPDKKYPVYGRREHPSGSELGILISTINDLDEGVEVNDKYFANSEIKLVGDNEVEGGFSDSETSDEPKLSYSNNIKDEMPNLRGSF
jgi:hypothetical protein